MMRPFAQAEYENAARWICSRFESSIGVPVAVHHDWVRDLPGDWCRNG